MVVMAGILIVSVLAFGNLFLRLHTLPERIAHKSHKLQFEVVAVLGLIALFTHMHIFWIAGLLLALMDIPDVGGPLRRMAGSMEKVAGFAPGQGDVKMPDEVAHAVHTAEPTEYVAPRAAKSAAWAEPFPGAAKERELARTGIEG